MFGISDYHGRRFIAKNKNGIGLAATKNSLKERSGFFINNLSYLTFLDIQNKKYFPIVCPPFIAENPVFGIIFA